MPKVIIEETITSNIKTGVGKHTLMLNELIKNANVKDYEIISNCFIQNVKNSIIKRIIHIIWLNTFFVFKLLFEKRDTIVIYTSFLPFIKLKKIKQIGIIHDVLNKVYPKFMSKQSKNYNDFINKNILKYSNKILTVSNTVREEIAKYYNYPIEKIEVLYNTFSIDKNIPDNVDEILEKYGINSGDKYIISVSSLNKNKNLKMLIQAFDIFNVDFPNVKLMLIGGKSNAVEELRKISDNTNIIFTGYISDNELKALYSKASLYVFPSIYEGFGIPIIDAQLIGIPVVCSDIPIFHEIGRDSVLYFELNKQSIAASLNLLMQNETIGKTIASNEKHNISRFSIEQLKKQLIKLIEIN